MKVQKHYACPCGDGCASSQEEEQVPAVATNLLRDSLDDLGTSSITYKRLMDLINASESNFRLLHGRAPYPRKRGVSSK